MSRQGAFMIYCTEQYKTAKNLTGKQVSELFSEYNVWEYIYSCFEALHTTGAGYIVNDIDCILRQDVKPSHTVCRHRAKNGPKKLNKT